MENKGSGQFKEHFGDLPDPRIDRTKQHKLIDIVVIAICAVICGADDWGEVALFGEAKEDWFRTFLELPNGIPSHDTFNRVFARLDPEAFRQRFLEGVIAQESNYWDKVIEAHGPSTIHAADMEEQVHQLMKRLSIPQEWYEMIAAYYISDHGMADFERESDNLRQELTRFRDMYTSGYLTQAQFQERAMLITKELQSMTVTAKPEAQQILPLLPDFGSIWAKAKAVEQRGLLKKTFLALYFDGESTIRQALPNSPFDRLAL